MSTSEPKKRRILLIDDDKQLVRLVQHHLERGGYEMEPAYNGADGLRAARTDDYDFIILDLMLPEISGLDLLKQIREEGVETPVLVLSARGELSNRVAALKLGADDYMVKPFKGPELLARIEAILRRVEKSTESVLRIADLECHLLSRTVKRGGRQIALSTLEFKLLEFFLRNKNTVLSRSVIAEHVWGYTFDTGTNIVEVYISYLRTAINEGFEKKLIRTVRGEGYVLEE